MTFSVFAKKANQTSTHFNNVPMEVITVYYVLYNTKQVNVNFEGRNWLTLVKPSTYQYQIIVKNGQIFCS